MIAMSCRRKFPNHNSETRAGDCVNIMPFRLDALAGLPVSKYFDPESGDRRAPTYFSNTGIV